MKNYFTMYRGNPYVSESYLYQKGISQDVLDEFCKKFRDGKSSLCAYFQDGKWKWFLYHLLPTKWISRYSLPKSSDELHALIKMQQDDNYSESQGYIEFVLKNAWNDPIRWKQFIPIYRPYFFDRDIMIRFSKTHSLFNEILQLKERFTHKAIFEVYSSFTDTVFWTLNANSFSNKIKAMVELSIEDALIHHFKRRGRGYYKVSGLMLSRIKFYYSSPLRYSYPAILTKVNNEMMDRELPTISLSTLKRVLGDAEIKNKCQPIRLGKKYAGENIYPHLNRRDPEFAELLEIDSTELNIPIKMDKDGAKIGYLWLCVVMEVHTRMIVGFSFSFSENTSMIMEALRMALTKLEYLPKQLLHDNHKAFYSKEFKKFSNMLFEIGVDFRAARIGNPRDKAHVERWFGTLQTEYLNSIYGSLGEGIRTKRKGGRAQEELDKEYRKQENLRNFGELSLLIEQAINDYNNKPRIDNQSPEQRRSLAGKSNLRKIRKEELQKLFYKQIEKQIKKSSLRIKENGKHDYVIYNKIIADKLNGLKVTVRYDPEDMSLISLYDSKTDNLLADIPRQKQINPVASNKELGDISKHYASVQQRIKANLEELTRDFNNGIEELESIPVTALNSTSRLKQVLAEKEENKLLKSIAIKPKGVNSSKKTTNIYKGKGSLKPVKP